MIPAPDLVVTGGTVVQQGTVRAADLAIRDGRILGLAEPGSYAGAKRTIDASGLVVLPGLIDPHVHIQWPFLSETTRDDYYTGTVAAAFGGTTTVIDFAMQHESTPEEAVERRLAQMRDKAVVDYALTAAITRADPASLAGMRRLAADGIAAFKAYMIYRRRGIMVDDGALLAIMRTAAECGRLMSVHAENAGIAEDNEARLLAEGKTGPEHWPACKPNLAEKEAVHRAACLARSVGCTLYIRHLSTAEAALVVETERRTGLPVYAETCTQYLTLDDRVFRRPDAANYLCSPPIRSAQDVGALWDALHRAVISTIASDHCAFSTDQKRKDSFTDIPNGLPGLETRLPVVLGQAARRGVLDLAHLADALATNAAKLFGLYPRKGALLPGSDADVLILDPKAERRLRAADLHMPVDWSPYDEVGGCGSVRYVLSRGDVIINDGAFAGRAGRGQLVPGGAPIRPSVA